MSDFQKWSVLAFRAMDDAGRVLMTIEPESTTEGERLDQLKETIRELLTQALLLNGVCTRRQLDERFQFGKLDTDALNVQLGQQQAEPVAWMDREGDLYKMPEIKNWAPPHVLLYTTPPQRQWVGLTDEAIWQIATDCTIGGDLHADKFARAIEAKLKERNNG